MFLYLFQIEDDEKLKKRKERFGALTNAGSAGAGDVEVCPLCISSTSVVYLFDNNYAISDTLKNDRK